MNITRLNGISIIKERIFETIQIPIVVAGPDGIIIYANRALIEMWGYSSADEIINHPALDLLDTSKNDTWVSDWFSKSDSFTGELVAKKKDGAKFSARIAANLVIDESDGINLITASFTDLTELKNFKKHMIDAINEKKLSLKEMHHRINNNMQLICSILNMQKRNTDDEYTKNLLREIQNRIISITLIHEKIYRSGNLSALSFLDYIHSLAKLIHNSFSNEIVKINLSFIGSGFKDFRLDLDGLIPFGLILNEVLMNSFMHAFKGKNTGMIKIILETIDLNSHRLTVSDNGSGLPGNFNTADTCSAGFQIINALIKQIKCNVLFKNKNGCHFVMDFFSKEELKSRELDHY